MERNPHPAVTLMTRLSAATTILSASAFVASEAFMRWGPHPVIDQIHANNGCLRGAIVGGLGYACARIAAYVDR